MKNENYILKAIANLAVAIEFATWASEAETYEEQIKWLHEVKEEMSNAEYWINESNILPF